MQPAPLELSCVNSCVSTRVAIAGTWEFGLQRGSRADLHFASDRGDIVLKNLAIGSQTGMFASVAL